MTNLTPPSASEERFDAVRETFAEAVNEVQGWCPACGGSGMVMECGPIDCPNVELHMFLASLEMGMSLSFWEAHS